MWKKIVAGVLLLIVLAVGANALSVGYPLWKIAREDPVGRETTVFAYHGFGVDPGVLVYDLWKVPWDASAADVTRLFFTFSEAMRERGFREVRLAYRGEVKFVMDGQDFQTMGDERHFGQNPVYMVRTMPEKLHRPDGSDAFSEWTGGLLGVTMRQMEDFTEMHRQWYLEDMLGS